jgi:hypothetical protein
MPPAAQPKPLLKPRLLVGEGQDEVFFFEALLAHLGMADVQVEQYGGKGNLARYLNDFLVRPRTVPVVSLGLTRDADGAVGQTFQSIAGLLAARGLPQPAGPVRSRPDPCTSASTSCRTMQGRECWKTYALTRLPLTLPCPAWTPISSVCSKVPAANRTPCQRLASTPGWPLTSNPTSDWARPPRAAIGPGTVPPLARSSYS